MTPSDAIPAGLRRKRFIVESVLETASNHRKAILLRSGTQLSLHRFACVGPNDRVAFTNPEKGPVFAVCQNGLARISPVYRRNETIYFGGRRVRVEIKEIETEQELEGYRRLSDYHYRGVALRGRRVPLIATVRSPFLPRVVGYVELSTTFIMNKARSRVLDAEFTDPAGLGWHKWDLDAMKSRTNLVVRVARSVIYPELRSQGLGSLLLRHSVEYSAEYWHCSHLKPYFVEITADMLKYLPFAEKAGFRFIGYTEGNLNRVGKDMRYLLQNYGKARKQQIRKEFSGILDLQVNYASRLKKVLASDGAAGEDLQRLLQFNRGNVSERQYRLLHGILRFPKPTYLKGLTPVAEGFLRQRLRTLEIRTPEFHRGTAGRPITKPIEVERLTITVESRVRQTRKTRAAQEAFGIRADSLRYHVISDLSFKISPGATLLVTGPSGAGKTLLLNILSRALSRKKGSGNRRIHVTGTVSVPKDGRVGLLQPLDGSRPIVEVLGGNNVDRAIFVLNMAGLSEANLYLKRFGDLSAGQQFRATLAKMLDSDNNVWIADEFCANLDPLTAYSVTRKLRELSSRFGATLIVAAPHWNAFIGALKPDRVLYLMPGRENRVFTGRTFSQAVVRHARTLRS
jgi:ABC-type lipoprotein export system ATPase subunit/GNAT superfamily N-acetyltransferase